LESLSVLCPSSSAIYSETYSSATKLKIQLCATKHPIFENYLELFGANIVYVPDRFCVEYFKKRSKEQTSRYDDCIYEIGVT